jgi:hypothetical protein
VARLEARLHADAQSGAKGRRFGIAADLDDGAARLGRRCLLGGEKRVTQGLKL